MPNYEVWVHHGEAIRRNASEVRPDHRANHDRMQEMLDDIRPDIFHEEHAEMGSESQDPPTPEVVEFFKLLKASEEPLHEHTTVTVLAFVTRLMAIQ
jgi:hypothetical protein